MVIFLVMLSFRTLHFSDKYDLFIFSFTSEIWSVRENTTRFYVFIASNAFSTLDACFRCCPAHFSTGATEAPRVFSVFESRTRLKLLNTGHTSCVCLWMDVYVCVVCSSSYIKRRVMVMYFWEKVVVLLSYYSGEES